MGKALRELQRGARLKSFAVRVQGPQLEALSLEKFTPGKVNFSREAAGAWCATPPPLLSFCMWSRCSNLSDFAHLVSHSAQAVWSSSATRGYLLRPM